MHERIVLDPGVQHGRPVIEGARLPVYIVLAELAGRSPVQEVADNYSITEENVYAAISYARSVVAKKKKRPSTKIKGSS